MAYKASAKKFFPKIKEWGGNKSPVSVYFDLKPVISFKEKRRSTGYREGWEIIRESDNKVVGILSFVIGYGYTITIGGRRSGRIIKDLKKSMIKAAELFYTEDKESAKQIISKLNKVKRELLKT